MVVHDELELDELWRDGLRTLAPVPVEAAHDRVERRVAHRRRRRQLVAGVAIAVIPLALIPVLTNAGKAHPHVTVAAPTSTPMPSSDVVSGDGYRFSEHFEPPIKGAPTIAVLYDENGLHFDPPTVAGGEFNVSFTDERFDYDPAKPSTLEIYVTGPGIAASVRAGTVGGVRMCPGAVSEGVLVRNTFFDLGGLDITASPECTTPVT
ncbi:MAG TPA: hypothetical protein VFR41_12380 [Acidimicrobiia bacterium]|nr:hypothetical protein [Acidimicrobiia bacterium]